MRDRDARSSHSSHSSYIVCCTTKGKHLVGLDQECSVCLNNVGSMGYAYADESNNLVSKGSMQDLNLEMMMLFEEDVSVVENPAELPSRLRHSPHL